MAQVERDSTRVGIAEQIGQLRKNPDAFDDSLRFLVRNNTPAPPEEFLDPDGHLVLSFGVKFSNSFDGWAPGQRIRSRYRVGAGGATLHVSEAVAGVETLADEFSLLGLKSEDRRALEDLGIAELDATVEIVPFPEAELSTGYATRYMAEIVSLNAVQPVFDGNFTRLRHTQRKLKAEKLARIKENFKDGEYGRPTGPNGEKSLGERIGDEVEYHLRKGTGTFRIERTIPVLVEGEVMEVVTNQDKYRDPSEAYALIKLSDGNIVRIELFDGELPIETPLGTVQAAAGDYVQVQATFGDPFEYEREFPSDHYDAQGYLIDEMVERYETLFVATERALRTSPPARLTPAPLKTT